MEKLKNKTILIIDDNPMSLLLTSKVLADYGCKTRTADSWEQGRSLLESELPALILLDIMMPDVDGYEVCRRIKVVEKWKEIPVIFLTANKETENLVEGFDAGGVDYITKPFKSEELLMRVKNHIELAESRKTILEMIHSRDKLYSIIAHDIRSPLSGILQTVDAIDQGYFNPCSVDFKEIIHHLSVRARDTSTLLTSLLQWTSFQNDNEMIHPEQTNIYVVLASCIELLKANAQNKNISITMEVGEDVQALCDEVSMHTVFRNLINNAIKFTHINGSIHIACKAADGGLKVSIQDSGIGMSQEAIEKIFEKNQHFTSSGTENEQGTGLGLMLVKDFVRKNNGSIGVESQLGKGTTFSIILPTKSK
jgi:two-component system sensor histidine kinase/response regulator